MKKRLILISASFLILLSLGVNAYATSNKHLIVTEQEITITNAEGNNKEQTQGSILFKEEGNNRKVFSLDNGVTWEEITLQENLELEYKAITEEDILKDIEEAKINLEDNDFMEDFKKSGKTEQDMLEYIKNLENQLEDVRNRFVYTKVISSKTIEGEFDIMSSTDEDLQNQIDNEFGITFENENRDIKTFVADTKDELLKTIEIAYKNNEISKENYEGILNQLN